MQDSQLTYVSLCFERTRYTFCNKCNNICTFNYFIFRKKNSRDKSEIYLQGVAGKVFWKNEDWARGAEFRYMEQAQIGFSCTRKRVGLPGSRLQIAQDLGKQVRLE